LLSRGLVMPLESDRFILLKQLVSSLIEAQIRRGSQSGLSVDEMYPGLLGHSFTLVADGLESAADVVSGPVVLFGLKLSVKPPSCLGCPVKT